MGLIGIALAPDLAFLWVVILGLSLGAVFPLVLTLPLDVAHDPARVGSVAALMLLGGYVLSSLGPVVLGTARDVTGDFEASLWIPRRCRDPPRRLVPATFASSTSTGDQRRPRHGAGPVAA